MTLLARWKARLVVRRQLLASAERGLRYWRKVKAHAKPHSKLWNHAGHRILERRAMVTKRADQVAYAARVIKRHTPTPLRIKAYRIAASQVGVMETGGNNQGVPLERYERSNGATGPEPWCGDFQAWTYRKAGSKVVTRLWASVWYLGRIAGVVKVSAANVKRGDLVRFTFSHVGMFVRWRPDLGPGHFETIEGNTGASGAVSDSSTGGDGVYRKIRTLDLVEDFRHITR